MSLEHVFLPKVYNSKFLAQEKYGFLPFTVYTIIAGSIFMVIFLPGLGSEISSASMSSTLAVIYLGLFSTVLPYFALAYVTSKVGAAEATSSLYLTPLVAIIISWVWLGEIPTLLSIVGGVLTLIGVSISNLKINKSIELKTTQNKFDKTGI
ncbi:DMT family transporter [Oceanobacillus caeni]|uniref:DMT family transporter n=1 Tax=Oceanobacillus sp. FSL K6-0118 TaxID=2921418 RepID=UPI002149A7A2|nr:DMT family transporter [Oceanobacillus caeni]MCR1835462.1 DMT family transporter [Oceanobacillus caeni]